MKLRRTKAAFIHGSSLEILSKTDPSDEATLRGFKSNLNTIELGAAVNFIQPGSDSDGEFIEIWSPGRKRS